MNKYISSFLIALVALVAVSCDFNDQPEDRENKAQVNFYLVDAPGDFEAVWVEVLAIRVKMDDDDIVDDDDSDDEDDSSWVEIPYEEGSQMVNLLDLTGNNSLHLGSHYFDEGEIDQFRLLLGTNNYVVIGGEEFDLKTPSAQQSGLKIKIDQDIEAGQSYDLIIDFDVAKSIVIAGNSGNINLKPVLRAYMVEAAGISGQVLPQDAQQIMVTASRNGETFTTYVDENGNFKIQGLEEGIYSLTIKPNENYHPVILDGVEVDDDGMTVVDPIVLEEI